MIASLLLALAAPVFAQPWGEISTQLDPKVQLALNRAYICPVDETPIEVSSDSEAPLDELWKAWDDDYVPNPWDVRDGWTDVADRTEGDATIHLPKVILLYCKAARVSKGAKDVTGRLVLKLQDAAGDGSTQYKDRFGGIWSLERDGDKLSLKFESTSQGRHGYGFDLLDEAKYPGYSELVRITSLVGEPIIKEVLSPGGGRKVRKNR